MTLQVAAEEEMCTISRKGGGHRTNMGGQAWLLVALFLVADLVICNTAPQAFGSGTALQFDGESYATTPMRFEASFLLSFWLRSRDWFRGSETMFSLNDRGGRVVMILMTTGSKDATRFQVFLHGTTYESIDLGQHSWAPTQLVHFSVACLEPPGWPRNVSANLTIAINGSLAYAVAVQDGCMSSAAADTPLNIDWGSTNRGSKEAPSYSRFMSGDLDDVRLWSNVEEAVGYSLPLPNPSPQSLVAYYSFDTAADRATSPLWDIDSAVVEARVGEDGSCTPRCIWVASTVVAALGGDMIVTGKPNGDVAISLGGTCNILGICNILGCM